jgi:hypothetical protein
VIAPERVVAAVVRAVDHPGAEIIVGRVHHLGARAHRLTPRLYDRVVGPVVDQFALRDIPAPAHDGNVFTPDSQTNAVDDGWRTHDHRPVGRALAVAAGMTAVGAAAAGVIRSRRA